MRHQPFAEAMSQYEAGQPEWTALCAGFLVLRHFDDWLMVGISNTPEDLDAVALVRRQIEAIPDSGTEVRVLLATVVDVLARANPTDLVGAVGPLLAYSSYLDEMDQQSLGRYVLTVVTEALDSPRGDRDLLSVICVYLQGGRAALRTRDFDSAEAQYKCGLELAQRIGNDELALLAQISIGNLWLGYGNLDAAESLTKTVIVAAQERHLLEIEACALHQRGCILQRRGQLYHAITDLSAAYAVIRTRNPSLREILLNDLAACTAELGFWDAATAIQEHVARTARSRIARGIALVNLLEAAVLRGDQHKFRTILQELQAQYLHVLANDSSLYVEYYTAKGIEHFQGVSEAIPAYRTVATKARQTGILHVERLAQERLDTLLANDQLLL